MRSVALATWILAAASNSIPGQSPAKPAEAASDAVPTISERTRGLERHDGFLPFYWDARRGQLLLEVAPRPEEFLYGSGLAGGAGLLEVGLDRGQSSGLGICRFERVGPRVLLVQRQTTHASGTDDPERTRVVEESFPSSVLASLPIAAEQADRLLVDATAFLLADTEVLPALQARGAWGSGSRMRRARPSTSNARAPFRGTRRSRPC